MNLALLARADMSAISDSLDLIEVKAAIVALGSLMMGIYIVLFIYSLAKHILHAKRE